MIEIADEPTPGVNLVGFLETEYAATSLLGARSVLRRSDGRSTSTRAPRGRAVSTTGA